MRFESLRVRFRRFVGVLRVAANHVRRRATGGFPSTATLAIGIVAIATALLVIVTGISLGLATQSTVYGSGVNYWIVPDSESTLTTVVTQEGARLGDTHGRTAEIKQLDEVQYATPVLIEVVRVRGEQTEEPEFVLGVGVVAPQWDFEIAGIGTDSMASGDPHYADGDYDEPPTGEIILSSSAAKVLNSSVGDNLVVASPSSGKFDYGPQVTAIEAGEQEGPWGDLPVAIFQLSELQTLTGADTGDQANQILVQTNDPAVESELEDIYRDGSVLTSNNVRIEQLADAELPLAISLTALIIALAVTTLFVATTMGLEIESDRQLIAILAAVGISARGRLLFVAAVTLMVTFVGGVTGSILGWIGIQLTNWAGLAWFGVPKVALFDPLLIVYAVGVALLTGILASPYPMVLARRTNTLTELRR